MEAELNHLIRVLTALGRGGEVSNGDEAGAVDTVNRLNCLCSRNYSHDAIARAFPVLTRLFQRVSTSTSPSPTKALLLLAVLQFFLDYGDSVLHDTNPGLRVLFRSFLTRLYSNPTVAAGALHFLGRNKLRLLSAHPGLLSQYFPLLLKLLVWGGPELHGPFLDLFPALIAPSSFLPLFPAILDLPTLAVALEHEVAMTGSLPGVAPAGAMKNAPPEALLEMMDEAYTGSSSMGDASSAQPPPASSSSSSSAAAAAATGSVLSSSSSASAAAAAEAAAEGGHGAPRAAAAALLADLVRRDEDGGLLEEKHWSNPALPTGLEVAMGPTPSERVLGACELAPSLLQVYFGVALAEVDDALLCALLQVMMSRIDSLFPNADFQHEVRHACLNGMVSIFQHSPSLLAILQRPIIASIGQLSVSPPKAELCLQLCWVVGEYGWATGGSTDVARALFEAVELLVYESLAIMSSASAGTGADGAESAVATDGQALSGAVMLPSSMCVRALCVGVTALAKLASWHGMLMPRAQVCLVKVSRSQRLQDARVASHAAEYMRLMQQPALFAALLASPGLPPDDKMTTSPTTASCHPASSSLAFYLLADRRGMPTHEFAAKDIYAYDT